MGIMHGVVNRVGWAAACLGLAAGLPAIALEAQQPRGTDELGGTISGTVLAVDAASPLPFAIVTLTPLPSAPATNAPAAHNARAVVTRHDGTYRFSDILPAAYRLHIRCIGYQATSVDVELLHPKGVNVSVALEVAPVLLRPIEVHAVSSDLYAGRAKAQAGVGLKRVEIEQWRQRSFLTSDVRVLTHDDVLDAVTLGASDPFRALQRLPGVTARDNWAAEVWTRGAAWDQTRVYFDGLPLFNPLHAGGVTTAVNDDVLGSVLFHSGVRSVSLGEGAVGVINFASRPAGGTGDVRGYGTLGWLAAGLTLERRFFDGRVGALVGGRVSPDRSHDLPKDYVDIVARVDVDLGAERYLELSGIWERDWIRNSLDGGPTYNRFAWGNLAARLTLDMPVSGAYSRHTIGFSQFDRVARQTKTGALGEPFDVYNLIQPSTDGLIRYLSASGEFGSLIPDETETGWRAGYQLTHQFLTNDGAPPAPYPIPTFSGSATPDGRLTVASLWAEARWKPARRLRLQGGIRVEGSRAIQNAGRVRLAPQLSGRYAVTGRLNLTAGLGRSYQYLQTLGPAAAGSRIGPGLAIGHVWLLAGENTPAVQSDIVSIGAERWLGRDLLASVNLYLRRGAGITLIDPTPGPLPETPKIVVGRNHARGIEIAVRRLAGRLTWSAGYTYALSEMQAAGLQFPAAEDRRHALDVTSTWHVPKRIFGGSLAVAQAYSAASGAPYTRLHPGWRVRDSEPGSWETIVPDVLDEPNAARTSWLMSLDQRIDWEREFSAWRLGFYLHNWVGLGYRNEVTYTVSRDGPCRRGSIDAPYCDAQHDRFAPDVPWDMLAGVRIWF